MNIFKYDEVYYSSIYDQNFAKSQDQYLEDYFLGKDSGFSKRIKFLMKYITQIKFNDVLDLGCGVGTFALLLAKSGKSSVGLDISKESIDSCK